MTYTCNRRRMRLLGLPMACFLMAFPLNACAEIEVGAEVAKRISRSQSAEALAPTVQTPASPATEQIQLAQATTDSGQSQAISPFLKPAPKIFEATGLAVWDGKRTLQGVWVAHPLATSARRVRIFNENNGQAVDGALFKRDTTDSGASILISSEAAQLLGMDVGTPAELRIVAVSPVQRQADPAVTDPTTAATDEAKPETVNPVASGQTGDAATSAGNTPTESTNETVAIAPTPAAKPVTVKPAAQTTPAPAQAPTVQPKTETIITKAEPIKPQPSTTKPAETTASTQAATSSPLKLPYVQAGIFGVKGNAEKLIRRIKAKDLPALGRTIKSKGKTLTRVLAGPFQTVAERSAALRVIRRMGLKDAAPVRR